MHEKTTPSPAWVDFTRRTNDPKLAFIERELGKLGIPHRRFGRSFHAPILQVPHNRINEAWALLDMEFNSTSGGLTLDDMADDHPTFAEAMKWPTTSG